ncbi:hypothetical protein CN085_19540 [Sinorhizobium meliloti]|uniref:hypothetical protein n=1 Tax=Rhizobium meliloti TaxID=382 RepID=UPI000FDC1D9C|nr:hypothetical protein [Sinorhizobium meliloti]RVP13107.1 hypothetical protein CN085_19540 [Sinorhizobium meliloti]
MTDRPAIKPLVWEEIHYNRSNEEPIPELTGWYAETEVGSYYVMLEGRIEVTLDGFQFHKVGSFDEPEAAFEAAQSDFTARIRSCLLDKPEAVEGEIERVARAIDGAWWAWADVHYSEDIPGDRLAKQKSLDRAKAAIAALTQEATHE